MNSRQAPIRADAAGASYSVVIPVRNRAHYLVHCLESIAAEQRASFEIEVIIVDDGSTEDIAEIVDTFRPRPKLIRTEGVGPSMARNAGIAAATADYVIFLDSDDVWRAGALESYRRAAQGHQKPAIIAGTVRDVAFTGAAPHFDDAGGTFRAREFCCIADSFGATPFLYPSALAVRRDLLCSVSGFVDDRHNAEDLDLLLRLGTSGPFVMIDSPGIALRRMHGDQLHQDFQRAFPGLFRLVARERRGVYAGGWRYAPKRRSLIASSLRYYTEVALDQSARRSALALGVLATRFGVYTPRDTFAWIRRVLLRASAAAWTTARESLRSRLTSP